MPFYVLVSGLVLLLLFLIGSLAGRPLFTLRSLLTLLALLVGSVFLAALLWARWRLWRGFEQWPRPAGRYYQRWQRLSAPERASGYYAWLAEQKHEAEPWRTWARQAQESHLDWD